VDVDTSSIRHEIFINGETGFNGSTGEDSSFDLGWGVICASFLGLVLGPGTCTGTLGLTLSRSTATSSVWVTSIRDDTSSGKEFPGLGEVTTLTSEIIGIASDEVLWGEDDISTTRSGNAESVTKCFGGTESPA